MKKIIAVVMAAGLTLTACGLGDPPKPGVIKFSEYDPAGFEWKKKSGSYKWVWESAETELTLTDGREYDLPGNRKDCVPGKTLDPAKEVCS